MRAGGGAYEDDDVKDEFFWAAAELFITTGQPSYRADLLASFELFEGDAAQVNTIEGRFAAITPDLVMETAREYLRTANRTILTVIPGAAE